MTGDPILAAHEAGDHDQIIAAYSHAANDSEARGDIDAACFFLTQAYVFALHAGAKEAHPLNARLVAYGRDAPLETRS